MRLTNIDIVGAKTGKKLSSTERTINDSVNFVCSWLVVIAISSCAVFVGYLAMNLIILLYNV